MARLRERDEPPTNPAEHAARGRSGCSSVAQIAGDSCPSVQAGVPAAQCREFGFVGKATFGFVDGEGVARFHDYQFRTNSMTD